MGSGIVYLVGAGPGDPGLMTLRGAECLRRADIILYDYLAGSRLLSLAKPGAELICLGRHGHGRLMSATEIQERMIREAGSGKIVVRLKGGDPAIFARLGEEATALESVGIPYEIVPGITAAMAAGSYAGISLTHRDFASCVAFVTGQESPNKSGGEELDYAALAQFPGTLVFYMGVTTAADWSRALVGHGKSSQTPIAIVRRCTFPDQETILGTLGEAPELMASRNMRPPAIVIVGDVLQATHIETWFTSRPLFGQTILVTRPEGQTDSLADRLHEFGAEVLFQPAIVIRRALDPKPIDAAIHQLVQYDWLVFLSSNGVEFFCDRLKSLRLDSRALGKVKLAAIGPATVAALERYQLRADVQPDSYRAEALAESLAGQAAGKRFLIARASRGREVLAELLIKAGATVDQVVVYESRDVEAPDDEIVSRLATGKIDWTTVTSSAIARSLVNLFGDELNKTRLAAISPLTAEVLIELGYRPAVVAKDFTTEGVVAAILAANKS